MQEETKRSIWKWIGYVTFFLAAFTYFIYRTFPYKQIFDRYTTPFQRQIKARIKMTNLQPYWLSGIHAENVVFRKNVKKGIAAVKINRFQAHASLFSLIFGTINSTFEADLAKGTLRGSAVQSGKYINLKVNIDKLSLNSLGEKRKRKRRIRRRTKKGQKKVIPKNTSLLATLFAPVYGRLKTRIRLKIPLPGAPDAKPSRSRGNNNKRSRRRRTRRRRTRGIDLTKLTGRVKINIRGLSMGPGEFPTAQMGELPVPLLRLGTFVLQIKIAKGKAEIVRCVAQGADGELELKGSLTLRANMKYAVFRGELKVKINKSFINNLDPASVLKTGLGMLGPAPSSGFYRWRIRVPFNGRPTFRKF